MNINHPAAEHQSTKQENDFNIKNLLFHCTPGLPAALTAEGRHSNPHSWQGIRCRRLQWGEFISEGMVWRAWAKVY